MSRLLVMQAKVSRLIYAAWDRRLRGSTRGVGQRVDQVDRIDLVGDRQRGFIAVGKPGVYGHIGRGGMTLPRPTRSPAGVAPRLAKLDCLAAYRLVG